MATAPVVLTLKLQGLTVTVCPNASGFPAGKLELVTLKIQDPNSVVPAAVLLPEAMENAGVVAVLVNCTVVVPEVPNEVTPLGKVKGVLATAPATAELAFTVASPEATKTEGAGSLPPQAIETAAATAISAKSFNFIEGLRKVIKVCRL